MKFSVAVAAMAGLAAAAPHDLVERQLNSNDVENGPCQNIFLVYARGSTEVGNMGELMGPQLCNSLKRKYPNQTGCQGVGGPYRAGLMDNVSLSGTTPAAIGEASRMLNDAMTKCPNAKIVAGGYSQGSAVMMNAIRAMSPAQMERILGVIFFGYTKNAQNRGQIPGFPSDKLKVICKPSDGVCGGALLVTAGHLSYDIDGSVGQAAQFLESKIDAA
ncbi:carbohydrate esterase family 5 protein, partial [Aulographum hederae CBS 113979]